MTALAETLSRGSLLAIRTLRVASGDGSLEELRTVRCPGQDRSMALERCLACADSGGMAQDPGARGDWLWCRNPVAGGEAPARGSPAERTPVHSVMTARVTAVRPDVSLESLTELLLDLGIGGAPVVDDAGRPVGVVSKTDLLRERFERGDTAEADLRRRPGAPGRVEVGPGFHAEDLPRATVSDVMTRAAFTISEKAPISQAAALMAFEGVHRVPVVSEDGRVSGIVTTLDLLRWLAQVEGYLLPGTGTRK